MTRYVYRFEDGTEVEVSHSMFDDARTELVHPDSFELLPVKRVPQATGATFQGEGWARKS
jgi:predicted nucleic acid-binding Zn ribbon protein